MVGSDVCSLLLTEDSVVLQYDQLLLLVCNRKLKFDAWMVRHNSAF